MYAPHPALVLPGSFRLGSLRIPVYGLFATAGLISALALSQRTAKFRHLDPNKLWDAGMFAVIAAFVASRALLIVTHLEASITFPLLMLTLPSLTYTGMFATALLTYAFLRWQRIPVLPALDAWAPCAAILAAVLQLGHFFEGTDAGMPTSLPWGVTTPGDTVLGRVHPVQLYAAFAALALTEFLLIRLKRDPRIGIPAAFALTLGGTATFLLDFLRQPADSQSPLWLDPSQFLAIAAVLTGAVLLLTAGHIATPLTASGMALPPSARNTSATSNASDAALLSGAQNKATPRDASGTPLPPSAGGATPYQRGATPLVSAHPNPRGLKARPIDSQEQTNAQ